MAGAGKPGPKKTFLYGNKSAALAEALEKGLSLRVGVQFNPDECRALRDFMDLHEVAEPTQALRLAIQLGTTVGSRQTATQRLRSRIIMNEIRQWVIRKTQSAFKDIELELGVLNSDTDVELARLQAEYEQSNTEPTEG